MLTVRCTKTVFAVINLVVIVLCEQRFIVPLLQLHGTCPRVGRCLDHFFGKRDLPLMVVANFGDNKTLRTITYGDTGNF